MGSSKFMRPKQEKHGGVGEDNGNLVSSDLYVANCGPAVGLSYEVISMAFTQFGEVKGVYAADETDTRVIVSFSDVGSSQAAFNAFNGRHCSQLGGRFLHMRYSVPRPSLPIRDHDFVDVSLTAEELNIPGLHLFHDFITPKEEEELLAAVDSRPWISLAKRRVQHYGYEFCYQTRNVDITKSLGGLPSFVSPVLERISASSLHDAATINLDQLTVNEYPPGVGLSPHIDTHSAFEDKIFSLSLAGPCIMEFRRYQGGNWQSDSDPPMSEFMHKGSPEESRNFLRRAIHLPPRSILLLSGEARYAWHHYIPHHKIDNVKDNLIRRASRRVSFTLRKVRTGPCCCEYGQYCDSRR
ncbi:alkylated DNA repair protein ALKBH8 homolog isoform X1 [Beta vulgaris subsp. vulgaris]|uniref:alkylated DNA repair protein ALKBH8 homolog isoform X1 n=1 Tax=Beta vulgaris subsp. vulgaris TaxID=3555 RepID=UPI002036C977|nr:alkylated DNA repair protein ALKBH8 homolog isoform X1 [Beta vulgaris subsp. vulgaris]